ncbi:hypothetical protein [Altererythrobacter aquiaggeris]|uniref:hypothetical protein n=1 Tax=Aestuarierythrobacter aquiaggeris TaxID=1898396 RepID=UPI0030181734
MSYRTLKARIARQERRNRHKRAFAPVIITIHPDDDARPVVGAFGCHGERTRHFDEGLPAFIHRAANETGQRILCAKYPS